MLLERKLFNSPIQQHHTNCQCPLSVSLEHATDLLQKERKKDCPKSRIPISQLHYIFSSLGVTACSWWHPPLHHTARTKR